MPEYSYQAGDEDGHKVSGKLSAESASAAIAQLEARGLSVQSISASSIPQTVVGPQSVPTQRAFASPFDSAELDRRFDSLIERREVLIPAFVALADELPSGGSRRDAQALVAELRSAQSGADLRRSRDAVQWLPLLSTNFTTESTSRRLTDLVAHAASESQNQSQRRRLLAYPIVLLIITLIVLAFLCVIVVPTFGSMFGEFALVVPTPTRMLIFLTNQLRDNPIEVVIVSALLLAVIYSIARLWVRFALTTRIFGLLVAGNSSSLSAMSSLTSLLAELLSIDVSLPDALWLAGQGCRHYHFKNVAEQLARDAHDAVAPLSESPAAHHMPANVMLALQAGENGGPHISLLHELANLYGDRANQRFDWFTGAMAQFAIVAIGILVGFIVIALFAPLVQLVSVLN